MAGGRNGARVGSARNGDARPCLDRGGGGVSELVLGLFGDRLREDDTGKQLLHFHNVASPTSAGSHAIQVAPPAVVAVHLRLQHLSRRTEAAYVYWTKRFIRFSGLRQPAELGASEVRQFLSHLVVDRKLSAATQQQRR